jgi:hypothetical protein
LGRRLKNAYQPSSGHRLELEAADDRLEVLAVPAVPASLLAELATSSVEALVLEPMPQPLAV